MLCPVVSVEGVLAVRVPSLRPYTSSPIKTAATRPPMIQFLEFVESKVRRELS